MKPTTLLLSILTFAASFARADQYHYSNILIGDRAIGLGGAYAGISDDASGVYYNPAGLGFAISNDVSGSANALYSRKVTYKKTVASQDFHERSSGNLPSFFGGLQKLDHFAKGLVFAFGMYTTDSELKDQNDLIPNKVLSKPSRCIVRDGDRNPLDANGQVTTDPNAYQYGAERPDVVLRRFHRTVNQRANSYYAGGALGYRISPNTSVGFGLNYVTIDELVQEYQDIRRDYSTCDDATAAYQAVSDQSNQNIRQRLTAYGLQPVLGFQTTLFERFSLGLAMKFSVLASQSFEQEAEVRSVILASTDQTSVDNNAGSNVKTGNAIVNQYATDSKSKKPLGSSLPSEYRLGMAFFASTRLLLAYDIMYISGSDPGALPGAGNLYRRESVVNHAAGMEYYLLPAIPLRLGLFTNNDARPEVKTGGTGQPDHIDYMGYSVFVAWVQPNSQIGVGVVLQTGEGKAQKVAPPSEEIQTVQAESSTFAFSASHSF